MNNKEYKAKSEALHKKHGLPKHKRRNCRVIYKGTQSPVSISYSFGLMTVLIGIAVWAK